MQCRCGSEVQLKEEVKDALSARLEFQVCEVCSRVSEDELFVERVKIDVDDRPRTTDHGPRATVRQLATLDVDRAEQPHSYSD